MVMATPRRGDGGQSEWKAMAPFSRLADNRHADLRIVMICMLAIVLFLASLGCSGGDDDGPEEHDLHIETDLDLDAIASLARETANGAAPDGLDDFRFPTADDIGHIQNQGTLHLATDRAATSIEATTSCAGSACPHLDSIQTILPVNSGSVMRTTRGVDMIAGYRHVHEDTLHMFYGSWMEHGTFGVHLELTTYAHQTGIWYDGLRTGFASIASSSSRPVSDAIYHGAMVANIDPSWGPLGIMDRYTVYQGNAYLRFHLDTNALDVEFSEIVRLGGGHPLAGLSWVGLPVAADGTFVADEGAFVPDVDHTTYYFRYGRVAPLRGAFAGTGSEEVMGAFSLSLYDPGRGNYVNIPGAFGARRVDMNEP